MADGCSPGCQVEADWSCPAVGPCTPDVCGNLRLARYEECDDGNTLDGDGCNRYCVLEMGWRCSGVGLPCRPDCGDSLIVGSEACDDGNRESGDGCSRSCQLELPDCEGLDAPADSGGAGASAGEVACATPVCGDGLVVAPEDCDDGALRNDGHYGGCNADCTYAPYCGDGVISVDGFEECDTWPDFLEHGKGGCTRGCRFAPYCGDGYLDGVRGEQCDDGDGNGASGCSPSCSLYAR